MQTIKNNIEQEAPLYQWVNAMKRLPELSGIDNKVIVRYKSIVTFGFRSHDEESPTMYFEYSDKSYCTNAVDWLEELPAHTKYQSQNPSSSPTGYLIDGEYFSAADFTGQTVNAQNVIVALWNGPQVKVAPDELVEAMEKAIASKVSTVIPPHLYHNGYDESKFVIRDCDEAAQACAAIATAHIEAAVKGEAGFWELKEMMIKTLLKRGSEKMVVIGQRGSFSGVELANEVQQNTEIGPMQIKNIMLLAVDLLQRDKVNIGETKEEMKCEAAAFAEWSTNSDCSYVQIDTNLWVIPGDTESVKTTAELYDLYKQSKAK